MFERYDEHARRSIFFARAEASNFGSSWIETEHLLLGILQEDSVLQDELGAQATEQIRAEITRRTPPSSQHIPLAQDLPLSDACKRALAYMAEEAERQSDRIMNPGHLVLGLLRVKDCMAAELLGAQGIDIVKYRSVMEKYRRTRV
ncbi:MAG TPA: Clp protease N-terminal domain-containing protein [Bryobacteraceae bacterium]|nr:Clp protease N-terminal domain-containing protein [Bryobacteraceae bacterium]